MSVPSLFRYYGHQTDPVQNAGLKVLKNLSLRVTPPLEFNDPFEFTPVVRCLPPEDDAREYLKKVVNDRAFFESHRSEFPNCENFAMFQRVIRAKSAEIIPVMAASQERLNYCFQQEVLPTLSKHYGVICFTAAPDHPLMWAHYGAAHTGLMLEFASQCPLFAEKMFFEVDYAAERAPYDGGTGSDESQLQTITRRKGHVWSYEREYRVIVPLARTQKGENQSHALYFYPIKADWIKSITVGLRASVELKNEIVILRRSRFSHTQLFRMSVHPRTFDLDRTEISHF
jgi:hypothetical protein